MIGSLRGSIISQISDGEIVLEVGGVGYRVMVCPRIARTLIGSNCEDTNAQVFLHVHTHVREDAIVLYGFNEEEERRCFELLLGAHGVGPSLALGIISELTPKALANAVTTEDIGTLCKVPGVGRKTAARLVIDLKEKLEFTASAGGSLKRTAIGKPGDPNVAAGHDRQSAHLEAWAALIELGYTPEEVRIAMNIEDRDLEDQDLGVEELLRLALRELAVR